MKKQLSALLITALLAPSTASNIQAGIVKKTTSGICQVFKIGVGLGFFAGGIGISAAPFCLDCCERNSMLKFTGLIPGVPTSCIGLAMVASGIKKLRKLSKPKHHHHHPHDRVEVVIHTDGNEDEN